MICDFDLNLF